MTGLTDVYGEWFDSLAPEVAKELAVLLMRLFPGQLLEPAITTAEVTDGLVARMSRLAGASRSKDAGTCLTLVVLTDLIFEARADPEQWAQDRDRLEVLDEARTVLGPEMDGDVADWVAQTRLQYPLRVKLWEKAAQSWASMRDGRLSDPEIRAVARGLIVHN